MVASLILSIQVASLHQAVDGHVLGVVSTGSISEIFGFVPSGSNSESFGFVPSGSNSESFGFVPSGSVSPQGS